MEFSGEDIINPDLSVSLLEQLGAELQMSEAKTRTGLAECFRGIAPEYGDKADFVAQLGEALDIE